MSTEALCLTPEQVKALQKIDAAEINGNVVIYGEQFGAPVEFLWADFDGNLRSLWVAADGSKTDGETKRVEA